MRPSSSATWRALRSPTSIVASSRAFLRRRRAARCRRIESPGRLLDDPFVVGMQGYGWFAWSTATAVAITGSSSTSIARTRHDSMSIASTLLG
jgi:hypothetical protein